MTQDFDIEKGSKYYYDMYSPHYGYIVIEIKKVGNRKCEAVVRENHVTNNDYLWEYFETFKNECVHFYAQNKRIRKIIKL